MALTAADRLPVGPGWAYELKWDGFRGLATLRASACLSLRSRNGTEMLAWFPELARLGAFVRGDALLDGEVVVLDEHGRPDFGALRKPGATRTYVAFDVLEHDGRSLLGVPLRDRQRLLRDIVRPALPLVLVSQTFDDGPALFAQAQAHGLEGVVAKRRESVYRPGERSRDWVKVKTRAGRATMARRQETWGHEPAAPSSVQQAETARAVDGVDPAARAELGIRGAQLRAHGMRAAAEPRCGGDELRVAL